MMSNPRRIGPSNAAAATGRPVAIRPMTCSRSGSNALNRSISHVIVEADQSRRHIALDRRVGEHPTSTPMTEPSFKLTPFHRSPLYLPYLSLRGEPLPDRVRYIVNRG